MKTPEQIRNMEFQKSTMGGYKQSDVELFLEEVASEIEILSRQKAEADRKLQEYAQKAPEGGLSAAGIENILVNAQRTADSMVEAAREEAANITAEAELNIKQAEIKANEIINKAENDAVLLGETAEKEAAKIIAEATAKAEQTIAAAKESIDLEQKLYDRLIIEVSDYRKKAVAQCAAVMELINQLPGEIPFNMERAKTVLAMDFNNPEELLKNALDEKYAATQAEDEVKAKAEAEEKARLEAEEKARLEAEEKARLEAEEKARIEAEEKARLEAEEKAKVEAEEKARLEAETLKEAEETEETDKTMEFVIEEPVEVEEIQSVSNEAEEQPEETNEEDAIPVISNIRSDVRDDAVANMQLIFEDEIEEPERKVVTKLDSVKPKGRISFGVEEDEDFEEDDEPRLFFKRKKRNK